MSRESTLRARGEELGKGFLSIKLNLSERERSRLKSVGLQKIEEFQAIKTSRQNGGENRILRTSGGEVETERSPNAGTSDADLLLDEMMKMRAGSAHPDHIGAHLKKREDPVDQSTGHMNGSPFQMPGTESPSRKAASPSASSILDNLINMPVMLESDRQMDQKVYSDFGASRTSEKDFSTLQQHIDKLTQENFELHRRLDMQSKVTQSLSSENQELTESYNRQAKGVEDLEKNCGLYEKEILALNAAMETMSNERESCKSVIQELQDRIKALVNENVSLEERNRDLRISEVRMGKKIEESKEIKESLESQLVTMQKNSRSLEEIVRQFREENQSLKKRLQGNYVKTPNTSQAVETTTSCTQTEQEIVILEPGTPSTVALDREDELRARTPEEHESETNLSGVTQPDGYSPAESPVVSLDFLDRLNTAETELNTDESKVLGSIHTLMEDVAKHWQSMVVDLGARKAEIGVLRTTNHELSQKLAMQTQMLELSNTYGSSKMLLNTGKSRGKDLKAAEAAVEPDAFPPAAPPPIHKQVLPITGTERRGKINHQTRRWFFW